MSRIGKQPVLIPQGVTVSVNDNVVTVRGPKGELKQEINKISGITVEVANNEVKVLMKEGMDSGNYWGLYRALIANMVRGVSDGFSKKLEIIGVGYRAAMKGTTLVINIGYSHPVEFTPPAGITLAVEENNKITITGTDKNIVGLVSAQIRAIRKPEPYKGKGIKYSTEVVRRKAGKAAGKTA